MSRAGRWRTLQQFVEVPPRRTSAWLHSWRALSASLHGRVIMRKALLAASAKADEWAKAHGETSGTIQIARECRVQAGQNEQEVNEVAIAELQNKLARADVINVSELSGDTVKFGAIVTIVDEETREKRRWQIVGEPERTQVGARFRSSRHLRVR